MTILDWRLAPVYSIIFLDHRLKSTTQQRCTYTSIGNVSSTNVMVLTKEVPPSHYFLIWDNYSSFASLAYRAKNTLQKYQKVPPPTSIEKRVCSQSYVGFEKN